MESRLILALAVRKIASERHSGQWSTGYRKLCQAQHILDGMGFREGMADPHKWPEVRECAAAFLAKHRREIARNW